MYKAKPTARQLEWADQELGVLIHYLMDSYNPDFTEIQTIGVRTEMPPEIFAPTNLDTDQWIKAAADMGAKYAVLVANHGTGFSLWPTKVNGYSIANSPWKDGKCDVVAEFIASCRKFGLKPGLYYHTGVNGYYDIRNYGERDFKSKKYQDYSRCVEKQVTELWSEYGDLFEIWFDGGTVPVEIGGPDLVPILEKYQPDCICFQGPKEHPHNIRWVGNEMGKAPDNCWATTNNGEPAMDDTFDTEAAGIGSPDGKYWWPAETDVANRNQQAFGGGWNWKANEEDKVYSPEQLLDMYINSVGCNSNLLVGMAIATDGQFQDHRQFEDFGKLLKQTFGTPKAIASGLKGTEFILKTPEPFDYIVIREDISDGQNIRQYHIEIDGKTVRESNCIGHKKIIRVPGTSAGEVRLVIDRFVDTPVIRDIAVY